MGEKSELHELNVTVGVRSIHAVITRALLVTIGQAAQKDVGLRDGPAPREGFAEYVLALARVVNAHHLTEDELAFPYFKEKLPDMPVKKLGADHQLMLPLVARLDAVASLGSEGATPLGDPVLAEIEQAARELDAIWGPHIETEETYLTRGRLSAILDPAEEERITRMFAEHSQKNSHPEFLVLPFLLYNVPKGQRWVFLDGLPEVVTQELLPKAWKPQWAAMAPFLLDQ